MMNTLSAQRTASPASHTFALTVSGEPIVYFEQNKTKQNKTKQNKTKRQQQQQQKPHHSTGVHFM